MTRQHRSWPVGSTNTLVGFDNVVALLVDAYHPINVFAFIIGLRALDSHANFVMRGPALTSGRRQGRSENAAASFDVSMCSSAQLFQRRFQDSWALIHVCISGVFGIERHQLAHDAIGPAKTIL